MILSAPLVIVSSLGILLIMAVSNIASLLRSSLLTAFSDTSQGLPARVSSQYPDHQYLYPGQHHQDQFDHFDRYQVTQQSQESGSEDILTSVLKLVTLPAALMVIESK